MAINSVKSIVCIMVVILVLGCTLIPTMETEKKVRLRGRVLATINHLFGEGGTDLWQTFIFGVESKNSDGVDRITPVEISYNYSRSEGPLPESFFDHTKLYELQTYRAPVGDVVLESIAYTRSFDSKFEVEIGPSLLDLKLLEGVSKDLLKMDMVLPSYELYIGDYRVVKAR